MSGITHILNIGRMALYATQVGLSVTAHNIANVNTPGFSRQRLTLTTTTPHDERPGQIGTGVEASEIQRVYDQFIEVQLQGELADYQSLSTKTGIYEQLEIIFSGTEDSDLGADFHEFFSAWEDLAAHPEGTSERSAVLQAGRQLGVCFNDLYDNLLAIQEQLNDSVAIDVGRVNELTSQIAELNAKITRAEATGQEANDLRDSRTSYIEELSGLLDVQAWTNQDGMVNILAPGGNPLVLGSESWQLEVVNTMPNQSDVLWSDGTGNTFDITDRITSGSIGASLDLRDRVIPEKLAALDEMAKALIWEVNVIHSTSVSLSPLAEMNGQEKVADENVLLKDLTDLAGVTLAFADRIVAGELRIWAYDADGNGLDEVVVSVDPDTMTLQDLADEINNAANYPLGAQLIEASIDSDGSFTLKGTGGAAGVAVKEDGSCALAALGVNTFFSGGSAQNADVADAISEDLTRIGSGRVDADGSIAPGDNTTALAMSALRDAAVVGGATLEGAYSTLVGDLGVEAAAVYRNLDYQSMVVEQLENQRSSISGVNLDEEMLNIMKYQWAYQAAARLIQQAQDMLYTVVDMVR